MSIQDQAIQALIQSVEASNRSIEKTNEIVQELSGNVKELVIAEREHMLKLERQEEINSELKAAIDKVDAKIDDQAQKIQQFMPVINRAARMHTLWDSVTSKVIVVLVISILGLLGLNFT